MNLSIPAKDRLIFALDVPGREEAERYVSLLGDMVG
ncbi:MAG: orotidine-5'-phosphate decarboxylase, partial [Nitrospinae bacterium]|nr:orotidine-5'-phosphate decarboxylase [Nitrospinota bacterium]